MTSWFQDIRYGVRMLLKSPGTSATAIIALALGIGLTTTMFSIVQGAILRGLPFPESDRIMSVGRISAQSTRSSSTSRHDYTEWRDQQRSFETLAAFSNTNVTIAGDTGTPERFRGSRLTPSALKVLRVEPILGRNFTEDDTRPGAPPVALISHVVWTSRYRQEPSALGRILRINGVPTTVIGVLPQKFAFPESHNLWLPLESALAPKRGDGGSVDVFGRSKPGVSEAEAAADLALIAQRLADAYPENKGLTTLVQPFVRRFIGSDVIATLFTMLAAVCGVMLIACVNVTNLQMARTAERTKEIAVRTALGSGRWRIVRQLLAEGLLLSAIGSALGLAIAWTGVTLFMRAIVDTNPPFWIDVRLDPVVLVFATAMTVASALVSSLLPGWRVARADPNAALKDEGRGTTSLKMGSLSRWLVVVEVTVSCVLLVVSGLMIRSIVKTSRLDYPFATDVFYARFFADTRTYPTGGDVARLVGRLEDRLRRVGGVRTIAMATGIPGSAPLSRVFVEGAPYVPDTERPQAIRIAMTPDYFDVLQVAALEGRRLETSDASGALPVAVVGQDFARKFFPEGSAIGRRLQFGGAKSPWVTIVGVVPTLGVSNRSGNVTEMAYVPLAQMLAQPSPDRGFVILASSGGAPESLTSGVRAAGADVDDNLPIESPSSLELELWRRGWANRVFGGLFLTFGFAALLLAAVGLYGVMAFSVRRRTQEIGVRMALGASRGRVMRMLLWQGMWRVTVGVALGLWPGWFVGKQMTALTGNVNAADPVVMGATVSTLVLAGLVACLAPARRAASVDPLRALKSD